MKRRFMNIGIWVIGILLISSACYAATIVYSPSSAMLTIPAGASKVVSERVGIDSIDANKAYYTWLLFTVNGNLPKAWITVSPSTWFLSATSSSLDVAYTVAVPSGTPSGVYSAYLYAKAMASHSTAVQGEGIYVQVTVPPVCSGIPKLVGMTISPETIWPPNHNMENVTVKGTVENPAGCGLLNMGYNIEDEYGIYTSTGHVTAGADRNFTITIPVEAWREGSDKDGRHYRITVFAEDEAGIGMSETLIVTVPHDQRNK